VDVAKNSSMTGQKIQVGKCFYPLSSSKIRLTLRLDAGLGRND